MRRILLLILFFLLIFPTEVGVVSNADVEKHQLQVQFLDVGQGDATLVILPNQKIILIDGGPILSREKLIKFLRKKHIHKINLLVATHPDIDHIGGLITVLKEIKVEKVLDSGKSYDTNTYQAYMRIIKKKKIPIKKAKEGKFIKLDPTVDIQILNDAKEKKENNESSIVLKITYKNADILLTGDADVLVEEQMIAKKYQLDADVLKVGHHGSYTSTSPKFLEAVHPIYAIISFAKNNEYHHPHKSVLERLNEQHVQVYKTANNGTISLKTDGNFLSVNENEPIILTNNE